MHGMNTMTDMNGKQRRYPGRAGSMEGTRTIGTSIYPPPHLRERMEREVLVRNTRDGAMAWSLSAVVIDILLEHFGLSAHGRQDGASHD